MSSVDHITFIIAKQLLKDKKAKAAEALKKSPTDKDIEDLKNEIRMVNDELDLLNNW